MDEMNPRSGTENQGGAESAGGGEMAYCVKCRKKTAMVETQQVTMKNGRPAMSGKCGVCGTGMYKILSKK